MPWLRYEDRGAEYAEIWLDATRLSDRSTAIGASLVRIAPFSVDDFVTSKLLVTTRGRGREIPMGHRAWP